MTKRKAARPAERSVDPDRKPVAGLFVIFAPFRLFFQSSPDVFHQRATIGSKELGWHLIHVFMGF
jgi:hypothetical protein